MEDPNQSLKSNYYHQALELHLRCGAEVLRKLVQKKVELSGGTLKSHLNKPHVLKTMSKLHPKILRPDQFKLLYPEPKLQEMDITLLSCLVLNGDFSLSADEADKVKRLRTERNDLSHISRPELDDDTTLKTTIRLIDEIAQGFGKGYRKQIRATIAVIQRKELVTCHWNHAVVLLRGEIYMKTLIEMHGKDETERRELKENWPEIHSAVGAIDGTSHEIYRPVQNQQQFYSGHRNYHCLHTQITVDNGADASNTTYLRFSLTKWAKRFTRSINLDDFLMKLKKEGVVSSVEIKTIQTHYSKGEQYNDLVLKMLDKPDFHVLNFFRCLRACNSDLADLLENKADDGKSVEKQLKKRESELTTDVLRLLFRGNPTGEVRFEELQVAVEEELGRDVVFSSLESLVVQAFDLDEPMEQDYSFKGIVWTEKGIEALNKCSIAVNDLEYPEETSSKATSVLDLKYKEFANYMRTQIDDINDDYGKLIEVALIKECISSSVFADLSMKEIEDAFARYLPEKRLILGVKKEIEKIHEQLKALKLDVKKRQQANNEMFSDLRPFDALSREVIYQTGKVKFGTGNLLVPVHECMSLPVCMTNNSTTAFMVKETVRFLAACMNSRRNGTVHFGIEDRGHSSGYVKGLKLLQKESTTRLNIYVSRAIDICFDVKDIPLVRSCMRPFQLVQTTRGSFVLEMDVVPSASSVNDSFFSIWFPPKARQQRMFFVYNAGSPSEIVSVPTENVAHTIQMYQRNVKERAQLEQETINSHSSRSTIEKLRWRLTAGSKYCTDQYTPVLCCGKLTDVADETSIRKQFQLHASDAFLSSYAVLDFDTCTEQRKTVENKMSLQFVVRTTESFFNPDHDGRCWVYCNGNSDLEIPSLSDNEWYKSRYSVLMDAMATIRKNIPLHRALVIFLVFEKPSPHDPLMDFMKDCMNLQFRNECVVITDSEEKIKNLKRDIDSRRTSDENTRDDFFDGLTWKDIALVLRSVFQPPTMEDIRLPCSSGKEVFLSKQQQAEMNLSDIEILSGTLCQHEEQMADETRRKHELDEQEKFYRGEEVSWWNFHYESHIGKRDLFQTYRTMIRHKLEEEGEKIKTQFILHQPGAGGTTAGKYLLWQLSQFKHREIKDSYRCCVVKTITENTANQIYEFLSFEDRNPKPVVALIDNATDDAIKMLRLDLNEIAYTKLPSNSHLFCLLIIIKRVSLSTDVGKELVLRHKLSSEEKTWFERKYRDLEKNQVTDVETLISFNVMKKEFDEQYTKDLSVRFLKDVTDSEREVLKCLSLINTFDRDNAVPISIFDSSGHNNQGRSSHLFSLYDYLGKGPTGLVVPIAKNIGKNPVRIWNTNLSESMSLLIKRSPGSTTRLSAGNYILQHDGIMIISQALAKAVLETITSTENAALSDVIEYVLIMVKAHVREPNPMSKEFVRIVNSLFKTRQLRSEKGDTKEKFSDMVMELKKGTLDKDTNGCDTVIHLMNLCFDITQDAMVGQQLSRFYIDMKRFDKAEEIIKKSISLQPKNSYLLDTYGQIFYSAMVHQLSPWPHESMSIPDDQASEIIKAAFKGIQKFHEGQEVTFEEEGGGNNSCFLMAVKTSLELLENFYKFSFQKKEKDLVSFLNDLSIEIKDTEYHEIGKMCPIEELRLNGRRQVQIENSLRMLEETDYQLKHNIYTINIRKGEQLLLDLRERYERFYGNEQSQDNYKFKYGVGLKSIMTVYTEDINCLKKRVEDADINISNLEKIDRMKNIDRRDLLVFLGYQIVEMSQKGVQEERYEPITTADYKRLLRCSEKLLKLEKKTQTHRPHLEAYLYFIILNWPSETRHKVDNICPPSQLVNALNDWEVAFQENFRQSAETKCRAFPKSYFALGNRELGCDIVDSREVEQIWKTKRNMKRNHVKADRVLKEPFVTDILKRLTGTLNQQGTLVRYQVSRPPWHYTIDIKTYRPRIELSNRQVTFILLFTWAGPRANEIEEYEDDFSKSKEPLVATKSGQKTDQKLDTPSGAEGGPKEDNQGKKMADQQGEKQTTRKKKKKKKKH